MRRKQAGRRRTVVSHAGLTRPELVMAVVFCLVFDAAGLFFTGKLLLLLYRWQEARSWIETTASIDHVELKAIGRSRRTDCRYRYRHGSQEYVGTRVWFTGDADNLGSWQQDRFAGLEGARTTGQAVPCYVNPRRPEDSLLFRDLRPLILLFHILFAVVFAGIGFGLTTLLVMSNRPAKTGFPVDSSSVATISWDTAGRIRPSVWPALAFWLFPVAWFAILALPFYCMLVLALQGEQIVGIVVCGLMALVGFRLAIRAVRPTILYWRFRRSLISIDGDPPRVGGHAKGELVLTGPIDNLKRVCLTLSCKRHTALGGRIIGPRGVGVIWSASHCKPVRHGPAVEKSCMAAFDFSLPEGLPATCCESRISPRWYLAVESHPVANRLNLVFPVTALPEDPVVL